MDTFKVEGFEMMVPTYNGKLMEENPGLKDFDEPEVPVFVCAAEGVKIILGTHDYHDYTKPDVQIERRHNGWMIFLHPLGGSDASGVVVFLDDGRSFVAPESGYLVTDHIEMVEYEEAIAELDVILPSGTSCTPTMVVEKAPIETNADCHVQEPASDPVVPPRIVPKLPVSSEVIDAFKSAQEALVGDSNGDEHDALCALVEALGEYFLGEFNEYDSYWIIEDFRGWSGLDTGESPDQEDIDIYVREARPANSSPIDVHRVLCEWFDALPKGN